MGQKQVRAESFWFYVGLLGFLLFLLFRPLIEFGYNAPAKFTPNDLHAHISVLNQSLGITSDSLVGMPDRAQRLSYFKTLKDSLGKRLPKPSALNAQGVPLNTWNYVGATKGDINSLNMVSTDAVFESLGYYKYVLNNDGQVIEFKSKQDKPVTFFEGIEPASIATSIAGDVFGYNLDYYESNPLRVAEDNQVPSRSFVREDTRMTYMESFKQIWVKKPSILGGPERMEVELLPYSREQTIDGKTVRVTGYQLVKFKASFTGDDHIKASDESYATLIQYILSILVLLGLVVSISLRQIFRGMVEWRRVLGFVASLSILILLWRISWTISTVGTLLDDTGQFIMYANSLIFSIFLGLYGGMAYLAWESLARREKQLQVTLVDAAWRGRFFFRETGESVIFGYALGGILLGLLALVLYFTNTIYFMYDSQGGFSEVKNHFRAFSLPLNATTTTILVILTNVGVVITLFKEKLKQTWAIYVFGVLLLSNFFAAVGLGRLFATDGSIWLDVLIMAVLSLPLIYAYLKLGIITVLTGWWVFSLIIMITPYIGTDSALLVSINWWYFTILLLPLLFGYLAYRNGDSIVNFRGNIPEYEERISKQLRVEKEIEIARESQFTLMPRTSPALPSAEVFGFFIPSYEVGGDFYDFAEKVNKEGHPALSMMVVDVSGKAMKAAMHAVYTSGLMQSRAQTDSPADLLRNINPIVYQKTDKRTFITTVIAELDLTTNLLRLANAGHCLPVLKRNGKASFITSKAPKFPLGFSAKVDYVETEVQLQSGDVLLMYSDGLPEAVNDKNERFGFDDVLHLVEETETTEVSATEICTQIKKRIQTFSNYFMVDDTTLICLKIT